MVKKVGEHKKIEYLISLFFNTGRLIHERTKESRVDPVSMLKVEALRVILDQEPTMKELATYLRVTAPTVTTLVNALVRDEYCMRIPDEKDKRRIHLVITSKGETFFRQGVHQVTEQAKEVLGSLRPEAIDSFIQIMEEIKDAYERKN